MFKNKAAGFVCVRGVAVNTPASEAESPGFNSQRNHILGNVNFSSVGKSV